MTVAVVEVTLVALLINISAPCDASRAGTRTEPTETRHHSFEIETRHHSFETETRL